MKKTIANYAMALLAMLLSTPFVHAQEDFTKYVDPKIGTGGHGHVFLGANVPFGLVQLGPTQHTRGWDWCSGYHASDSILVGFSHTHLSGTGCGDLGDILFLPVTDTRMREIRFSHAEETCRPGYFSQQLHYPHGRRVLAEFTATQRSGMHRYSFSSDVDSARILIDLGFGTGWDRLTGCHIRQISPRMIQGCRLSNGWANRQQLFFVAEFSQDVRLSLLNKDTLSVVSTPNSGQLTVKVGLSAVSCGNAAMNLKAENAAWDFDAVAAKATEAWNRELGKIRISTDNMAQKRVFYTSLYHTMVAPSVFCDVNGEYYGSDAKIHQGAFTNLTTFSLWDTYRAWHPLSTLIHPEKQDDIANTMLNIYREQKTLPVWHLMGCETNCMVGCPAAIVLADQILKGFDVDKPLAIEAMRNSLGSHRKAHDLLWEHGYIPYDLDPSNESIGKGMEYAIAYGSAAKVSDDPAFKRLGESFKHYFDVATGFMRARSSDGKWREMFDPFAAEINGVKDYTEGNAWQYIWLAPHDVHGLVSLFKDRRHFIAKLDSLFIVNGDLGKDAPPDITGLIGQYAHGNEPSHHVAYLYNFVGQPWKTARLVREIMTTQYHDTVDGLCGNEDVGQMSAWFVLSSIGMYQVDPAGGQYVLGSPLFDDVTLDVGGGKKFRVVARNNSEQNMYIQSARLNGRPYPYSYINFKDIVAGGTLELQMGRKPSKFATKDIYCP